MAYCLSIELHAHVSSGPLGSQLLVEHCDNLAEFEQSSWFICWLSANTEGSRYYVANSDGGPDVSFVLCLVRACKHWYSFIMSSIVCLEPLTSTRSIFSLNHHHIQQRIRCLYDGTQLMAHVQFQQPSMCLQPQGLPDTYTMTDILSPHPRLLARWAIHKLFIRTAAISCLQQQHIQQPSKHLLWTSITYSLHMCGIF